MGDPGSLVTEGRAGERSWCLRRVGMNTEWLLLEDGNEVSGTGSLSCGAREVSFLCAWLGGARHCSREIGRAHV